MAQKRRPTIEEKPALTEFEKDSIWMSYRYCIGRSTIASNYRATEIVDFLRTRSVSKDSLRFSAEDINKSIDDILRMSHNFWYEDATMQKNGEFRPWMAMIEFLKMNNIISAVDLSTYTDIHYSPFAKESYKYVIDENKRNFYASFMTIEDLKIWSDLAAWMDDRCHHVAHCKDKDGNLVDVEYFDSYMFSYRKEGLEINLVKTPVDVWNGQVARYINEDYILSID